MQRPASVSLFATRGRAAQQIIDSIATQATTPSVPSSHGLPLFLPARLHIFLFDHRHFPRSASCLLSLALYRLLLLEESGRRWEESPDGIIDRPFRQLEVRTGFEAVEGETEGRKEGDLVVELRRSEVLVRRER